ncbi:hypothetical protein CIB84_010336, partial [Bambusicola thoracicus]
AQGCTKEFEVSISSFSISFESSPHAGSTSETKEHTELVALTSTAVLGCVVACTTWLVKRCFLRCSLWGLFTGSSAFISLAKSIFFFSTFTEGDSCLEEATGKDEEAADFFGD